MNVQIHWHWVTPMAHDIAAAQQSITLTALSLQPPSDQSITPLGCWWRALSERAAAGKHVEIILPTPSKIHPATAYNSAAAYRAHDLKMRIRMIEPPHLLHAKTAVIDKKIIWIGSGNFTAAAAHQNYEMYCRFESTEIAERLLAHWETIK
jgi:phosphatidylserine/phosphatidylglycerophosphate/cardiolipin synthase-like enzyme